MLSGAVKLRAGPVAVLLFAALAAPALRMARPPVGMECCPAAGLAACCSASLGCALRSCSVGEDLLPPEGASFFLPPSVLVLAGPGFSKFLPVIAGPAPEETPLDSPDPPPRA